MQPPEEKSRIEQLKESLYSPNAPEVRTRRKLRYGDISSGVKTEWERDPEVDVTQDDVDEVHQQHSMSFFTKLFIASIIFCLIAVGVGAYLFFNGNNLISADNINITVNGPVSVPGGAPVSFDISITNNNTVDLQSSNITISYPSGAVDPANPGQQLTNYREDLGPMAKGQTIKRTVSAILYGEENTQKQLNVEMAYNIKGSTAPFSKSKSYDILLNSSPVNLTVSSFKEITSGQDLDVRVTIKSNSTDTLRNILVAATYPFGFTFDSANIKPLTDQATWRLGDLSPGAERTIVIHGKLQGENEDARVFHFSVGTQSSRNANTIGTEFMNAEQEVAIRKPFISTGITLDGNQGTNPAPASFGTPVHVEVNYFNNLSTAVTDARITVKLSGNAYDKTNVQTSVGLFNSATDELTWNSQTSPGLASIGPGESGTLSFNITPRDFSTAQKPVVNPNLSFSVSVQGRRSAESRVPETLASVTTREAHVGTAVSISGQVVRSVGPFVNTGPIPPKAEQKTTYTIQWTVDNTNNPVHAAVVTAKLAPGIVWTNQFSPSTEDVSYDTTNGIVTWNVGAVGAYTLNTRQRKQISFQVSMEPNVTQVGSVPTLINETTLSAIDDFTNNSVKSIQAYLTTRFSTDPSYKSGMEYITR